MDEIKKLLGPGEKVLWRGKPVRKPFFMSRMFASVFMIIPGIIMTLIIGLMTLMVLDSGFPIAVIVLLPFILISLSLLFAPLTTYWWFSKQYPHLEYAITNKRVLLKSGWIGRDFKILDYDQIKNAEVNVNIFDKAAKLNTGSILFFTGEIIRSSSHRARSHKDVIAHIKNPYEVFKFLKKTKFDVKADIHFPNKYRPKTNPGYSTDLK